MPLTFVLDQFGEVETPDREYSRLQLAFSTLQLDSEMIRVGEARYVRGDLPFIDLGLSPSRYLAGARPDALATLVSGLGGRSAVRETVNGVEALRYDLTGTELTDLASLIVAVPAAADPAATSLWVTEDGRIPVKLTMEASAAGSPGSLYLEINITDLDDPDISVEPPDSPVSATSALTSSSAPAPAGDEGDSDSGSDVGILDRVIGFVGGLIGGLSGGFDPVAVYDAAEMAEENADDAKETIETVEEWREANPDDPTVGRAFREPDSDPEGKTWLYKWFWSHFE
jgi:hypothetical protein